MTRTTAAALALGSALTLAGCTSGSSTATPAGGTSTSNAPATSAAATSTSPSGPPSSTASSAPSSSGSASSTPVTTAPTTTSSTPTSTTVSSTRCRNSELRVSLGTPDRGAGQIYTEILFVNSGSRTCTLAGHPGVSYVAGDDGHQVGASTTRTGTVITTVTLKPGATGSALLHETNYQNFDQSVCKPVTVRGLRIYPPGSTAAVFIPRVTKQCSATKLPDPAMTIAVVKPGTGG